MSSKIFLQALQNKLKGGNARSIHLNALPGRFATRLDLKQLDLIENGMSEKFLSTLLSKPSFDFKISFDLLDLNKYDQQEQKKLGLVSKRLNAIIIENEDYFKEHGTKTLGFGYPILIKRSSKDPTKIIKAPLFIWALDAIKSKNKVNEWTIFRNKTVQQNGNLVETDIHGVSINEVLLSFIKGEDDILLPGLSADVLDDLLVDQSELLAACSQVLSALNTGSELQHLEVLKNNFLTPILALPEANSIDEIANNKAYIHFGGVFGLFRTQKESIITDIGKLLERFGEFEFDQLKVESLSNTPFSAVNTDPAQQAIITTLGSENNQIIQGPPGTGKSQSLTALVTNALANGLKCLVVCEKKTALDVIKRNIERTHNQMAQLVAVIDDVNEDRESIVDSVRDRQNSLFASQQTLQVINHYKSDRERLAAVTQTINKQHLALSEPIYNDHSWNELVGRFLQLRRKFNEIPLRYDLKKESFKFLNEPKELETLLEILRKANNLYVQSFQIQNAFTSLCDDIFINRNVGEAKTILEDYITNINSSYDDIVNTIKHLKDEGKNFDDLTFKDFPLAIRTDIAQYLPYIYGTDLSQSELPEEFLLETQLKNSIKKLQYLAEECKILKTRYVNSLKENYNGYGDNLKSIIDAYLNFVDTKVSIHGKSLFNNTKAAKAITNILSIFSDKQREKKSDRVELCERIAAIKLAQHQKNYLHHEYNDTIETVDLNILPENIRRLKEKVITWQQQVPNLIESFSSEISESNYHPEFFSVKNEVHEYLIKYNEILLNLNSSGLLEGSPRISEINILIKNTPETLNQLSSFLDFFNKHRQYHQEMKVKYLGLNHSISELTNCKQVKIAINPYKKGKSLDFAQKCADEIFAFAQLISKNLSQFRTYYDWKVFYQGCTEPNQELINLMIKKSSNSWEDSFECWYLFWILTQNEPQQLPRGDYDIHLYNRLKGEFDNSQLNNIMATWLERQAKSVTVFKAKGSAINSLFNKKGAKGKRRNSLRTIVKSEFHLFTDFFPVVLLNPSVCSSIIPLEEGIFDLVIFDEASQLRLEDTFAAFVRGKAKIISGDKHQMAPSSYFEGSGAMLDPLDDEETDEENSPEISIGKTDLSLADSESLLAYAVDKNFKESYLTVHYRSQHPFLIDFSNHAFYGERLIPVPAKSDYIPIEYFQVNGEYENSTNRLEALKVVSILKNMVFKNTDGTYPSVGVATFNLYQRNLILEEISAERRASTEFDSLIAELGDSFFVKNLENIQGDERDIIIISTTFGFKQNGTFSQSFGPIIQSKGHRMLNVIITRAKVKIYICCSFSEDHLVQYPQLIQKHGNKGRGVLYAYLAYAKAVSIKNEDQRQGILNLLSQYCTDQYYNESEPGLGSESPFEDEVYSRLSQHIDPRRIEQQFKVGGFRIDMVIHPENANGQKIAIECDGAKYHTSPEAYAWDVFRQKQLENFGFKFHRIWSTKWWDSADQELEALLLFVHSQTLGATNSDS